MFCWTHDNIATEPKRTLKNWPLLRTPLHWTLFLFFTLSYFLLLSFFCILSIILYFYFTFSTCVLFFGLYYYSKHDIFSTKCYFSICTFAGTSFMIFMLFSLLFCFQITIQAIYSFSSVCVWFCVCDNKHCVLENYSIVTLSQNLNSLKNQLIYLNNAFQHRYEWSIIHIFVHTITTFYYTLPVD